MCVKFLLYKFIVALTSLHCYNPKNHTLPYKTPRTDRGPYEFRCATKFNRGTYIS